MLKPRKVTPAEAAGPLFDSKEAKPASEPGLSKPATDVTIGMSADKKMTAGLYKAGASDVAVDSYPEDEFCYFLTGSVKLTSTDGSAVLVKAGEAVFIPRGWKGRWTSPGYTKYYVVYEGG
jgi:uncharacterized cupin superfamily protein